MGQNRETETTDCPSTAKSSAQSLGTLWRKEPMWSYPQKTWGTQMTSEKNCHCSVVLESNYEKGLLGMLQKK